MDVVGVGVGAGVDVDVDADVDASAISSSAISISEEIEMLGSEVGATTAAASDVETCIMDDVPCGAASTARERETMELEEEQKKWWMISWWVWWRSVWLMQADKDMHRNHVPQPCSEGMPYPTQATKPKL